MPSYSPKRFAWLCFGILCAALGGVGILLPLLPTTPFILLATFAFARSSPRMHHWLTTHKLFGPMIQDWQSHRAISINAKFMSLISMIVIVGMSVGLKVPPKLLTIQIAVLCGVTLFIVTRAAPPKP